MSRHQRHQSTPNCPWPSWSMYFPNEDYDPDSPYINLVAPLITYFRHCAPLFSKDEIDLKHSVTIDYSEFVQNCNIPEFASILRETPARILAVVELAVYEVLRVFQAESLGWAGVQDVTQPPTASSSSFAHPASAASSSSSSSSSSTSAVDPPPRISVCLSNYEPLTPLKDLKANLMGKFIGIRGTVVRVSSTKPNVTQACFTCNHCQGKKLMRFTDGKYACPTRCDTPNCKGRLFHLDRSSPDTITHDWQKVRIQEIVNDDKNDSGRIPRCVEVELADHLVDSCSPGDIVHAAGIVKVITTEDGKGKSANSKTMYLLYIDANSITNCKSRTTQDENAEILQFSLKDMYAIRDIADQKNLFRLIVNSISPAIYGHELVKAGLALALFGGRRKYANDKNKISVRGDPHVLVVGDPGMGKSQMLQAVASIAPRGVYVCGNTTSTAGLTVTIQKDSSGDYALEAGALILGDQGCCCIDEFDKMGAEHQALLEAMEQQSISIAKAGICCSLPARTSVLAAANPVGGHYNKAKTVSENLKMNSALLSRFDLIFILLDKPDQEMDHFLSEHVMALHSGKGGTKNFRERGYGENDYADESEIPLVERLKLNSADNVEPIPPALLRKYIGYARKYVEPTVSPAAARVLQAFYLNLRKKYRSVDSTPITTRQLESMVRLTEARARLELREKVTEQDAQDVIDIMKHSLYETCEDEFGNLDFQRSQHGTGMSKGGEAKKFVSELQALAERTFNNLFTTQQLYQLSKDMHLRVTSFEDFIDSLNNQGYLLKKGNGVYKLQTSSLG